MNVLKGGKHPKKRRPDKKRSAQVHAREKRQFKKLLDREGIDHFERRFKVLETFLANEGHITANELAILLKEAGLDYPLEFIKDTLSLMVKYGFAETKRFDGRAKRYEHRHIGFHHDHMICTKCGRIIEFEDQHLEELQLQIAKMYGFHVLRHRMEIYGVCSHCLEDHARLIPLAMAKEGNKLIIKEYAGGTKANMRLINMGLRIGDEVEVITNSGQGQMIIAIGYNRMVLGRGMARKILAERIRQS